MPPQSKRISELDLAGPLTSSDQIVLVQQGKTVRSQLSNAQSLFSDGCQCTLVSRYTTVGTGNNTLLNYLQTYTLPDDIITVDGSWLEIHAAGTFAANGNQKLVSFSLKQNSTGLDANFSIPIGAYNDDLWYIDLKLQRSGEQDYVVSGDGNVYNNTAGALQTPQTIPFLGDGNGCDWTAGDLQLTIEGTNSTASANDITVNTFIVVAHLLDPNS